MDAATTSTALAPMPMQLWPLATMLLGAGVVLLVGVYMQPSWLMALVVRHSHPSVLWCASTTKNVCALTIDDAPSAATPQILDLLRKHNIKATFFVISNHIKGHEHVVKRIVDEGHRLGNHLTEDRASILDELHVFEQKLKECDAVITSFQPHDDAAPSTVKQDHQDNDDNEEEDDDSASATASSRLLAPPRSAVYGMTTTATKWLRPASGWFTGNMREIVASHGYRICMGSVYPHDAQIKSERINSMFLRLRTRPGSVIIVHDRAWTVGVLEDALPYLVEKFKFVSLDDLTQHHNVKTKRHA